MSKYDVIIIGAGAAGLSAAERLLAQGKKILVLEARDRIGGRVLSHPMRRVEYGAEFLHGVQPEVFARMSRLGLEFYDVSPQRLAWLNGRLQAMDGVAAALEKLQRRLRAERGVDRTVREFLNKNPMRSPVPGLFQNYVEGFMAADLDLIGEKGLALSEHHENEGLNGNDQFRPIARYTEFLGTLLGTEKLKPHVRLGVNVDVIDWVAGVVRAADQTFEAPRIVVTVPLSILKENKIRFATDVPGLKRILGVLFMGHVQRIALEFKERWWENLSKAPVSFLLAAQAGYDFPVFWTQAPLRTPYLNAWQGGPRALEMAGWLEERRVKAALTSLSTMTRVPLRRLRADLIGVYAHDWTHDPFSLGAYSYAGLDGEAAAARWRRPVQNKLFFAGEATESGEWRGTVEGAIHSGWRAAKQILGRRR